MCISKEGCIQSLLQFVVPLSIITRRCVPVLIVVYWLPTLISMYLFMYYCTCFRNKNCRYFCCNRLWQFCWDSIYYLYSKQTNGWGGTDLYLLADQLIHLFYLTMQALLAWTRISERHIIMNLFILFYLKYTALNWYQNVTCTNKNIF